MKKLLLIAILALLTLPAISLADKLSDTAYITLRCTTTVSIGLVDEELYSAATYYNFGDVVAGSTYVATKPIGVQNQSDGAICRWELQLDPASLPGGWSVGNSPGLDRIAMFAKFSTKTLTTDDFDVNYDSVSAAGTKLYSYNDYPYPIFYSFCDRYVDPTVAPHPVSWDASRILPYTYNPPEKSIRHLWVKIMTPTAISNPNQWVTLKLNIIVQTQ